MQEILNDFCQKMAIKNFALNTRKSYKGELSRYLRYCNDQDLSPNSLSFQEYLTHRIKEQKISECVLKQSIGAAKFFFLTA